jgi:hypothetical protein
MPRPVLLEGSPGTTTDAAALFFIFSCADDDDIPVVWPFPPVTDRRTERFFLTLNTTPPKITGVGKSTLIEALARAAGHSLTRVNLSEQTDIADLLGSDLPTANGSEGEGEDGPAFAWQDGPLLEALKAGHWVLLDELNLASQVRGLSVRFVCFVNYTLLWRDSSIQNAHFSVL